MKKLVPITLVLLTSASCFAFPFPWKASMRSAPVPTTSAVPCANFTGKWHGTCGDVKDVIATIQQSGCSYFVSEGESYHIGGFKNVTEVVPASDDISPGFATQITTAFEWNTDRTELKATASWMMQDLTKATGGPLPVSATWRLEADELVQKVTGPSIDLECRFQRQ